MPHTLLSALFLLSFLVYYIYIVTLLVCTGISGKMCRVLCVAYNTVHENISTHKTHLRAHTRTHTHTHTHTHMRAHSLSLSLSVCLSVSLSLSTVYERPVISKCFLSYNLDCSKDFFPKRKSFACSKLSITVQSRLSVNEAMTAYCLLQLTDSGRPTADHTHCVSGTMP